MNASPRSGHDVNVPLHPGIDFVRLRFAGDSGDGVQTAGELFTQAAADFGNDFATFPDYPAEIRAPAGSLSGVSTFSINLGSTEIRTHGDQPDALFAFNAAALAAHYQDLRSGGLLVLDRSGLSERLLRQAGFASDPREDGTLDSFQLLEIDISAETLAAVSPFGLRRKDGLRAKNMWALGLALWLFDRDADRIADAIKKRFLKNPDIAETNVAALRAGHAYGEIHELSASISTYDIGPARLEPGLYRSITGGEALALGAVTGARLAGLQLYYASYPITPASVVLHRLAAFEDPDVTTFQAEDEIAAACAAIGAAYGGALGVTASSGPGIALMIESIGLATAVELPLVIIDVQRAGPSTGMPTKAEQSDLNLAVYGRNGGIPLPVLAAQGASDAFDCTLEAVRIALRHMTPVILLADAYIANAAEPWKLPEFTEADFPAFAPHFAEAGNFQVFRRDPKTLARSWPIPGTAGLEHRIGGLERDAETGAVSYAPANHQRMTQIRFDKIRAVQDSLPRLRPEIGAEKGRLAVLGWGSTHGAIRVAVLRARTRGEDVSHIHLRHIWPLPSNLGELLAGFDRVLLPEMNMGQLAALLQTEVDKPVTPINKVTGQPFLAREISDAIRAAQ